MRDLDMTGDPAPAAAAHRSASDLQRTRQSAGRDALSISVAFAVLVAWDLGGLDLTLVRGFGTAAGFAWREHWFMAVVMHDGLRAAAWFVFAVLVTGIWWPLPFARSLSRRDRIWWVGTMLLCAALIPLIKRGSATSCPWSLAEFGGMARYVPHWVFGRSDGGPGRCFPSGHASTAFTFVAGWFALRDRAPRAARLWLLLTLAVGAAVSAVQMVRGAHYASHSMWTGWICWAVTALSYHAFAAWRAASDDRTVPRDDLPLTNQPSS